MPSKARARGRTLGLADALRARRRALRVTQQGLALLAGCGPDFVYDVERAKPTLRLDKLLDLLGVLGLELLLRPGRGRMVVDRTLAAARESAGASKARRRR